MKRTHLVILSSMLCFGVISVGITTAEEAAPATTTTTSSTTSSTTSTTTSTTTTTTLPPRPKLESIDEHVKIYVNNLTYNYNDPVPAMKAFNAVAAARGWTSEEIESWQIAAEDIMLYESGFCYNLRRGASFKSSQGCVLRRQGPYEDSGFGQLIRIHYNPNNGWLCHQENICSADEIVANPWNSMVAMVALIERSSAAGWCFADWARELHKRTCTNVGLDVPTRD